MDLVQHYQTDRDLKGLRNQLQLVLVQGFAVVSFYPRFFSNELVVSVTYEEETENAEWAVIVQPNVEEVRIADHVVRRVVFAPHQEPGRPELLAYSFIERGLGGKGASRLSSTMVKSRRKKSGRQRLDFSFD